MKKFILFEVLALSVVLLSGCGQGKGKPIISFPDDVKTACVTYYSCSPDTSRELSQEEIITIKDWAAALDLEHKTFDKEETPNKVYTGGETFAFNVNDGELNFSYASIDNDYIVMNDEWYLVLNPSFPPIEIEIN